MPIDEAASIIIEENGSHAIPAFFVFSDGSQRQLSPGDWGT
jgi:hypothetical protein